jgi:hypothetical protein
VEQEPQAQLAQREPEAQDQRVKLEELEALEIRDPLVTLVRLGQGKQGQQVQLVPQVPQGLQVRRGLLVEQEPQVRLARQELEAQAPLAQQELEAQARRVKLEQLEALGFRDPLVTQVPLGLQV